MSGAVFVSNFFKIEDLICLEPLENLEETLEAILAEEPDALITDFVLNEHKPGVGFDGLQLMLALQARKRDFPCFLTTGFAINAATAAPTAFDVNAIYSKTESFVTDNNELPFLLKVKRKIELHQKRIQELEVKVAQWDGRLQGEGALSAEQRQHFIDADNELEAMLGRDQAVPSHLKADALRAINELVQRSDAFLTSLESAQSKLRLETDGEG